MFLPLHDTNALNHTKVQYVTLGLIVANILIWIIWSTPSLTSSEAVHAAYLSYGYIPAVINGYQVLPAVYEMLPLPVSYVSYSFFHSDFMHLAGNMLFLWVFGDNVEDAMGHFRFLIFYLLCAAAGALAHGMVNPESISPLIGASGAAAGVVAAYLLLHPKVKIWVLMFGQIPLRLSALWVLGAWIAYQVYELVFNSASSVSWGAHVGGIITGAVLIVIMKRKGVHLFDQNIDGKLDTVPASATPNISKETKTSTRWGRDGGGE